MGQAPAEGWSETRRKIKQPNAVGAVIDLGYSLDLVSTTRIEFAKRAYDDFKIYMHKSGSQMPVNKGGGDLLQRYLDCAVINHIHSINRRDKRKSFETVRGVFLEGKPIYETSGFYEKNHIQICVRNLSNIKGVFRVPTSQVQSA